MRQPAQKYTYYFRRTDETDQTLYRLLMRHQSVARTKLFRELLLRGFRQYRKQRRAQKELPHEKRGPLITAARPINDDQPWK